MPPVGRPRKGLFRKAGLLGRTVVLCMGEFGRTPAINVLGGGGIRGGRVVGATDPEGKEGPSDPVRVADLHATVLTAVGIDPHKLNQTPVSRTVRFSEGEPITALLEKR
jgi:hypothetical protein